MFLRNLLLFNFIFNLFVLRTLTDARALPAGSKSAFVAKALQKSHRHVLKVKRSQESFLQGSCQDPGIPVNGHRVVVELEPQNVLGKDYFPISAKVRFGCESSFLLRGSATLSCEQGDGRRPHWDSSAPQCVGKHMQLAMFDAARISKTSITHKSCKIIARNANELAISSYAKLQDF